MTINMNDFNNMNNEYDKVFGAGAYNSGLQSARNAGALKAQASFAKQDAMKRLSAQQAAAKKAAKEAAKPTFQDALNYWNDPANKKDLLQKGAYRKSQEYTNDPLKRKELKDSGFNQKDFIDAMYNASSNGQYASKGAYDQFASQLAKDTKASNKAADVKSKADPMHMGMGVQDYYDYQQTQKTQQKKQAATDLTNEKNSLLGKLHLTSHTYQTNPVLNGLSKANEWLNTEGQRVGDQVWRTAFGNNFVNSNDQWQRSLSKEELKKNPKDTNAKNALARLNNSTSAPKNSFEKGLNYLGGTAGTIAPYLAGDGLLGVAEKGALGLTKGAAQKALTSAINPSRLVSNNIGKLALQGASSGLVGGGIGMGAHSVMSGERYTPSQIAANLALNAGAGAALNPLLHGIGSNLNLKGQLAKLLEDTNSTKYNADNFQNALHDTFSPKGDITNVIADPTRQIPKPFETMYNLSPMPKVEPPQPMNLKQNDWFNFAQQGSTPQGRGILQDTSVPKVQSGAIRSLAEDTLNKANSFTGAPTEGYNQRLLDVQKAMKDEIAKGTRVSDPLVNFAQQGKNTPKARMDLSPVTHASSVDPLHRSQTYWKTRYNDFAKQIQANYHSNDLSEEKLQNLWAQFAKNDDPKNLHNVVDLAHGNASAGLTHKTFNADHKMNEILKGTKTDTSSGFKLPSNKNIDELYNAIRQPHDPKSFDELIKMAQMEHNAANPGLKTLLRRDPKIKQQLDSLNAMGKPSKKSLTPTVETPKGKGLKVPNVAPKAQTPHQLSQALQVDPKIKPGLNRSNGQQSSVIPNGWGKKDFKNTPVMGNSDPLYEQAKQHVVKQNVVSVSSLQRHFKIGYSEAAKLIDRMESDGIVGPYDGKGPRKVLSGTNKPSPLDFPTIIKSVKTTKTVNSMTTDELNNVYKQLEQKHSDLSKGKGNEQKLAAVQEDMDRVKKFLDLQFFGAKAPKEPPVPKPKAGSTKINPAPKVKNSDITAPNPVDEHGYGLTDTQALSSKTVKTLQESKDIMPNQTLTKNIYELVDRLPKEIGNKIKTALDTAKVNHVNNLEQRSTDLYNKVVKGLGINKGSKESALVQDYGEKTLAKDYLKKQEIDPSTLSEEELNKINLEQLQQKTTKWENIVEADKYFREHYNNLINEVNMVREQIYPNNPEKIVPTRNDYYHHFNALNGFEDFKNLLESSTAIDPHLAGISPNTKPNAKWQGFMQMRGNGAYKSDAVGGFLKYLQASSHSTHIDPTIKVLRQSADQIATATEGTRNMNNTKIALIAHADQLAGKTNPVDRFWQEHGVGRKAMQVVNVVNGHIKKNLILGNLGSALGQVGNLPLTIGKAKQFAPQGLTDTLAYTANHLLGGGEKNLSAPISKSQFLKERFSGKYFTRFDNGLLKKPEKMAAWLLETADKSGTYFAWNSMYRKGLKKGVADPIKYADTETRHIIAGRGVGEVPIAQRAKVTQLIAPFTLEVGNQWKVLGKQMNEKDFAGVITFLAASYGLNAVMNQVRGSSVSYNPAGAVMDGYNKADGTTMDKAKGAGASLLGETVGNIPGGNYIPQILGLKSQKTKQALFGNRSPDRFGTGVGVASTVFKPITDAIDGNYGQALKDTLPLALPFGGNQIKKTVGGIDALSKGGSYDSGGKLQYPVDANNKSDFLHSLLLGSTTTAKGQDYYDNNRKPLSAKQTLQYQNAPNKQEYYNNLMFKRQVKAIQKEMKDTQKDQSLTLQEKQKNILALMQKLQKLQK